MLMQLSTPCNFGFAVLRAYDLLVSLNGSNFNGCKGLEFVPFLTYVIKILSYVMLVLLNTTMKLTNVRKKKKKKKKELSSMIKVWLDVMLALTNMMIEQM